MKKTFSLEGNVIALDKIICIGVIYSRVNVQQEKGSAFYIQLGRPVVVFGFNILADLRNTIIEVMHHEYDYVQKMRNNLIKYFEYYKQYYKTENHTDIHTHDEQCILDEFTNDCMICGVHHGDPCPECGQRGNHLLECSKE